MLLYSLFKPFYLFNCLLLVLKKPGLISVLIFLLHTLYNDTCNLTNPLFFHGDLMFSCFQPSTRVSRRSPWRPTHHRRGRTSHHGTAHHRATRSLIWVCILAASHPRKPGWAFEAKVTEQRRCVYDCTPLDHLLCVGFCIRVLFLFMFLLIVICFSLFRAACLLGSQAQLPCPRQQKSGQKTPGLCSREGNFQEGII